MNRITIQFSGWMVLALFAGVVSLTGCSGGIERPEVVPVGGAVMYKGEPVVGATVSFMSEKAPRAATGVTNDKGEFKLSTFGVNDGAVLGTHKITVTKIEGGSSTSSAATGSASNPTAVDATQMAQSYTQKMGNGKEDTGPKSLVPAKYGDMNSTPLSEEVKAGGDNQFVLQLTD